MSKIQPRIRESFARQSFLETLGVALEEADAGRCSISAPLGAHLRQQQGAGHGGFVFSLGDVAAGYAALSLLPEEVEVMSAELKIHFLRPAVGDQLIARGEVLKPGKRLMIVKADVFARTGAEEVMIATLLGTMVPVNK